jgi:uncharacterized protein (TIGR03000 family)
MYSLMLMAALTTGPATPTTCWGCHGCHGCWSSCSGCYCSGCWCSCSGCHCGGRWCRGCSGCYCSGCYCSCSCSAGWCSGCSYYCGGCYCGGCYSGCSCGGCYCGGCYCSCSCGGCYCSGCYACHGCYGCTGCYGGVVVSPAPPVMQQAPAPGGGVRPASAQEARITVKVPADAKLYVDGQMTTTNSQATRTFKTPVLAVGQDYYYTMRAEVERDGKTVTDTKRVIVRAGATVEANFDLPASTAVASK